MNYNFNSSLFPLEVDRYTNDFYVGSSSTSTTPVITQSKRRKSKYGNDNKCKIHFIKNCFYL